MSEDALRAEIRELRAKVERALELVNRHGGRHSDKGGDPGPRDGTNIGHSHDGANLTGTPGGELGGTWASPTVDSTHAGSAHHTRLHTLVSTADHLSANTWKVLYIDGNGEVIELALGADGTFLQANGVSAAPTFAALVSGDIPSTQRQRTAGFYLETPVAGDNTIYLLYTPAAITISEVRGLVPGGTSSPSVPIDVVSGTTFGTGLTTHVSAEAVSSITTGNALTIDDATVESGRWLWVNVGTITGTIPVLIVQLTYTYD